MLRGDSTFISLIGGWVESSNFTWFTKTETIKCYSHSKFLENLFILTDPSVVLGLVVEETQRYVNFTKVTKSGTERSMGPMELWTQ